jgi:hypothetical protein
MASVGQRLHVAALILVLVSYGVWSISTAISGRMWDYIVGGLVALVAATGVILSQRWARAAIYILAALVTCGWLWYVWLAIRVGYFAHRRVLEGALALVPGVAMICVAGYCCFVASRYVGRSRRTS